MGTAESFLSRSPAGQLIDNARAEPDQPWLFHQRGLDWRWVSWAEAARRMLARRELLRAALAAARAEPASASRSRIGYAEDGSPAAVLLDLAIQSAGGVPVPLPSGQGALASQVAESASLDFRLAVGEVAAVANPSGRSTEELRLAAEPARPSWQAASPPGEAITLPATGAVAVWRPDGWFDLLPSELGERLDRLTRELAGLPGTSREIVVLPRSLADPCGRLFLTWSLVTRAALLLEPDSSLRSAAARWARPTIFAGDRDEVGAFRRSLGEPRRRRRLPLGRLHTVVALGGALDAAESEAWRRLGVAVAVV